MVKELLVSNRQLREIIEKRNADNDSLTGEVYSLQMENEELRDRTQLLQTVIRPATHAHPNNRDTDSLHHLNWLKAGIRLLLIDCG